MNNYQIHKEIYKKYLSTPVETWSGKIALPAKKKVAKAIFDYGDKHNSDIGGKIEEYLALNKRVWLWSDMHFNHKKICELANRPFKNEYDMNIEMINNYCNVVSAEDLVVFGGDIAFYDILHINNTFAFLPGKKALILGNHDFNYHDLIPLNYSCFDYINSSASFNYSNDVVQAQKVLLTHYPLNLNFLPKDVINIHGHTHQNLMGERRINMSVEHTDYKPKCIHSFLKNF